MKVYKKDPNPKATKSAQEAENEESDDEDA